MGYVNTKWEPTASEKNLYFSDKIMILYGRIQKTGEGMAARICSLNIKITYTYVYVANLVLR